MADLRSAGFFFLGLALFTGVLITTLIEEPGSEPNLIWVLSHSFVGLAVAAPFALRVLGEFLYCLLLTVAQLAVALLAFFGVRQIVPAGSGVEELAALLSVVLILGPGGGALHRAVDALVLHQCRRRGERLRDFFRTLSPELGVTECSRRAVAEITDDLHLCGAALLLDEPPSETARYTRAASADVDHHRPEPSKPSPVNWRWFSTTPSS